MAVEEVRVDWVRDQVFVLRDHADFPILMTQPGGASGADLLPLSLIGCALWDVVAILRKQRQVVTLACATARSERDPDPPWQFRAIRIRYTLGGMGLDPQRVARAVELSEQKYCAIHATLRPHVAIRSDVEIVDAARSAAVVAAPEAEDARTQVTRLVVTQFNDACNRRDVNAIMGLMTPDCTFENTWPPPDGERHAGAPAVRAFWERFFVDSPGSRFEWEEVSAFGDRAMVRWRYHWAGASPGHVRGVDLLRIRDGLVSEKLSYVKG